MMASRIDKCKQLARIFHALGDKTRLRIIVLLSKGEMNVTAIRKKLELSQTTASHHIGLLRESGLLQVRRDGHQRLYSIADLTKHSLGEKSELTKRGSNSARFGPAELLFPKK
jgi:ArsR family transcriptional regulator, zinc-responsive transcriptional repressor